MGLSARLRPIRPARLSPPRTAIRPAGLARPAIRPIFAHYNAQVEADSLLLPSPYPPRALVAFVLTILIVSGINAGCSLLMPGLSGIIGWAEIGFGVSLLIFLMAWWTAWMIQETLENRHASGAGHTSSSTPTPTQQTPAQPTPAAAQVPVIQVEVVVRLPQEVVRKGGGWWGQK